MEAALEAERSRCVQLRGELTAVSAHASVQVRQLGAGQSARLSAALLGQGIRSSAGAVHSASSCGTGAAGMYGDVQRHVRQLFHLTHRRTGRLQVDTIPTV